MMRSAQASLLGLVALGLMACQTAAVQRYGMVTMVKPEKLDYYKELHANPWPGVLEQITRSNIRNYSIYLGELEPGEYYLFSYFEYVGEDFEADMARMAEDETTRRWWNETDPCQTPVPLHEGDGPWMNMEQVFLHE